MTTCDVELYMAGKPISLLAMMWADALGEKGWWVLRGLVVKTQRPGMMNDLAWPPASALRPRQNSCESGCYKR